MTNPEKNAPEKEPDRAPREPDNDEIFKLREEVHRLAEELGVPLDEATRMVYEERGIRPPGRTKMVGSIPELATGMRNISLKARIVSIQKMERDSGDPYFRGYLGDSEGEIPYTAWIDLDLEVNTPVLLQNIMVREWNNRKEVVINDSSFVSRIEDVEGLLPRIQEGVPSTLSELTRESRNIDVEVRIIESRETVVNSRGKEKEIVKGIVADRTGRMEFTCWGPMEIKEGGCYRIIGGYVKEFRGVLNLNLSPGSIFNPLSDDRLPPVEELVKPEESRVVNLYQGRFSGPVQLRGAILSIRNGSGLFQKCMECGRRMDRGACTVHGKTEAEWDLGFKGIFDDGSGTVFLKGDRRVVEELLGRSIDEIRNEVKENLDPDSVLEEIDQRIVGRPVTIIGDPSLDDYGTVVNASDIEMGWDPEQLEREIISMMEVMV
jgi:replication factor A1